MRSGLGILSAVVALSLGVARPGGAASALAGQTLTFEHDDAKLLRAGESRSAAVYVPSAVGPGARLSTVVFLHGLNAPAKPRPWMGGGLPDLRAVSEGLIRDGRTRPFLLAAPSQTRLAHHGKTLFRDFDLARFLDDVDGALGGRVQVDRSDVVVVAHSGAGCVLGGAGLGVAATATEGFPRAIAFVDTCLDRDIGEALARTDARTALFVRWQRATWRRDFVGFERAFLGAAPDERAALASFGGIPVAGTDAHERIVPIALADVLPRVLPSTDVGTGPVASR